MTEPIVWYGDEGFLHGFKQDSLRSHHGTFDSIADGRDRLRWSSVNGVFVEFGINESNKHSLDRFVCNWALDANFVEGFNYEFTGFVKVLNTLGVIDKNVGAVDGVNLPHDVLIHAEFAEFVSNFFGIAVSDRAVSKVACTQSRYNLFWQRLNLEEEPVVTVRGLALKCMTTV